MGLQIVKFCQTTTELRPLICKYSENYVYKTLVETFYCI